MAKRIDLWDLYQKYPIKALRLAIRRTRRWKAEVSNNDDRLNFVDTLVGGFGVEALRTSDWQNGYWGDVAGVYVNMGDVYAPTVIVVRTGRSNRHCRLIVSSLGDFVERHGERLGIY